jgi:hypothetical protein
MKREWRRVLGCSALGLFTLVILASAEPGQASGGSETKKDETATAKAPPAPVVEEDPAFERYVDIAELADAWEDLDSAKLADIGLQLAEGERVLLRSHKGVTAEQVLTAAARIATEKGDSKTLQRLARAADAQKREGLATQVRAGLLKSKASRSGNPALKVQIDQADLDDVAALKALLEQITAARLSGDTAMLALIARDARTVRGTDLQRKMVLKAVTDAQAALKEAKGDDVASALNKLSGMSRGTAKKVDLPPPLPQAVAPLARPASPVRRSNSLDITYVATKKGLVVQGGDGVAFAGGQTLQTGDIIVKVGSSYCGLRNADLDALIDRAYQAGNSKVYVRGNSSTALKTYDLPAQKSEGDEED